MKTTIIGSGSWGTALAILIASKGEAGPVRLWSHRAEHAAELDRDHENKAYLPGIPLPPAIRPTSDLDQAADGAEILLFVTPSKATREVAEKLAASSARPAPGAILLTCTKGFELGTGLRMSQILRETFPHNPVAVFSGPAHAEEAARGTPTASVAGAEDPALARQMQQFLSFTNFRTYRSEDVAGIELGGALKNIFAIGAGICDGLGLGDNTKAAVVTRSLAEMIRIGTALGGRRETFPGLSGLGDLMVTCFSRHSRNRRFGDQLGQGLTFDEAQARLGHMVAEGVPTARSIHQAARRLGLRTPVTDVIHAVLYENLPAKEAMSQLLRRDPRHEEEDSA